MTTRRIGEADGARHYRYRFASITQSNTAASHRSRSTALVGVSPVSLVNGLPYAPSRRIRRCGTPTLVVVPVEGATLVDDRGQFIPTDSSGLPIERRLGR